VGCTKGPESTTEAAREPERLTDSQLGDTVENRFKADTELAGADLTVDADAEHNSVTLSGTVATEALRTRAVETARAAHPGLTIEDKIDVKPALVDRSAYTQDMARAEVERARSRKETVGSTADDAWIHAKIVAELIGDKDTPERNINVDVDRNIVTLRGTVDTAEQKQEAERIARQTDGVKNVRNMLKLSKS
jgi:osmotically-inducible protein OsmY